MATTSSFRGFRSSATTGFILLFAVTTAAAIASACGDSGDSQNAGSGAASSAASASKGTATSNGGASSVSIGTGNGGAGGTMKVSSTYPCAGCMPFPGDSAPTCTASMLGDATIAYPPDAVLLPPNMNVLEVQFVPPAGATLFEVDFENSVTDVKVETQCTAVPDVRMGASKGCGVTLPQQAWNDIANVNRDGDPVKVTVRATADGACVTSSTTNVSVSFAKEDLAGGIYYWQSATYGGIAGKTGGIYSHDFGSFDPAPTPFYTSGDSGTCVGCHSISRDGARMTLATDDPDADDEFGDVHTLMLDVATKTVLAGGSSLSPGFQSFTHDHAFAVASTFKTHMNKGWDVLDVAGGSVTNVKTTDQYTQPDVSADDASLVYVKPSVIATQGDHHILGGSLYWSTFDGATPAVGAAQPLLTAQSTQSFYYPSFSPSLNFVVLDEVDDNSAANNDGDSFYNRQARVKLVHFPAGGAPLDLPNLNGTGSLSNSWPRWSPFVTTYKGHKIVWITFSSNRDYGLHLSNVGFDNCYPPESPMYDQPQGTNKNGVDFSACAEPQIWMAAVVVDDDASLDTTDRSFPAFWLPFQDVNAHNHSAQWVAQISNGSPDGGAPDGGDGGTCGEEGAACSQGCCADKICCSGSCTDANNCLQ